MTKNDRIQAFLSGSGDIITSKQVAEAGFHRSVLSDLVRENEIERVSRGVYVKSTAWEDEMHLLQRRFSKGVFSHGTALYLHRMSDMAPVMFTMTFPWGYNAASLKHQRIEVKRAIRDLHSLGVTTAPSIFGNMVRVYDLERTLCDIVRGNSACEISMVNQAMKRYAARKGRDIHKLLEYAERLHVKPKILNYMEVLL